MQAGGGLSNAEPAGTSLGRGGRRLSVCVWGRCVASAGPYEPVARAAARAPGQTAKQARALVRAAGPFTNKLGGRLGPAVQHGPGLGPGPSGRLQRSRAGGPVEMPRARTIRVGSPSRRALSTALPADRRRRRRHGGTQLDELGVLAACMPFRGAPACPSRSQDPRAPASGPAGFLCRGPPGGPCP